MSQPESPCPACESTGIEESIDDVGQICESCGYVMGTDIGDLFSGGGVDDETPNDSDQEQWGSYCTVTNSTEQTIAKAFENLEEIADEHSIQAECRERAADIYCDGFRSKITDGRDTRCVVAACLRLASLQIDQPIPLGLIVKDQDVKSRKFHKARLALQNELELLSAQPKPMDYTQFLKNTMKLDDSQCDKVESILKQADRKISFVGKDPAGVAAGAVYLASDEFTQSDVSKAVGLSTETVRQRIHRLEEVSQQ